MKKVILYGRLAKEFGPSFDLDVGSPAEAVRALEANFPGFYVSIREGHYRVGYDAENGIMEPDELLMVGNNSEIHIEPVVVGAKKKGIFGIILGIIIIGAAIYFAPTAVVGAAGEGSSVVFGANLSKTFSVFGLNISFADVALFGLSMALQGVAGLLSPVPEIPGTPEKPDGRPSFLFSGPINTAEQGGPVPLVYGQVRTGSTVISAGLLNEQLPAEDPEDDPDFVETFGAIHVHVFDIPTGIPNGTGIEQFGEDDNGDPIKFISRDIRPMWNIG